jgi:asparagine synthase (glutamine-hydrolysing)
MCGIAALYSPRDRLNAGLLRALQSVVRHRGPDDEGIACFHGSDFRPTAHGGPDTPADAYASPLPYAPTRGDATDGARLALAHRRLSVLDLSAAGHQPMCDASRDIWITYNGEIYNFIELRDELKALGHTFATQSDTEVILAAYRAWGRGCLSRFNGMFAFVMFDRARNRLFAARDRFGVKPLYYWVSPEGIVALASEIKQFTVLPGWRPKVNGQRAYDFLNWGLLDHTDETHFDGVFQLRGGEWLELELSDRSQLPGPGARLPVQRWYSLEPRPFSGTFEDAGHEFRRLLTDSVRLRLRADVPVGSCLSGGLDSSSIVCVMNELLREQDAQAQQKTFSACAAVKRFDERDFIDEVVRHTGTDAHYVYPGLDELFPVLDRITWHQDEPFGSTSIYAQWSVFALAAENRVKVMLDGQGADEQLAGYHNYFAPHFGGMLRGLSWMTLCREMLQTRRLHGYPLSWGIKQALNNVLPEPVRQPLRHLAGKPGGMAPSWLDMDRLGAVPRDPFLEAGSARAESVRAMSLSQLAATSLPMLLHWEDRDSMAHSIEARVPFLDYRLVEFVLGLPDEFKIAEGMTKRVLREGMRGILPERVRGRVDKLGFVTPEEVWVREQSPALFRNALRDAVDISAGIIKGDSLALLERTIEGKQPFTFLIWRLISFGAWMRVFSLRT